MYDGCHAKLFELANRDKSLYLRKRLAHSGPVIAHKLLFGRDEAFCLDKISVFQRVPLHLNKRHWTRDAPYLTSTLAKCYKKHATVAIASATAAANNEVASNNNNNNNNNNNKDDVDIVAVDDDDDNGFANNVGSASSGVRVGERAESGNG
jgi:hypothetical protein